MLACVKGLVVVFGLLQSRAPSPTWRAEVVIPSDQGMGGAAIGDLDPASPGNEVAVVNAAGEIWVARRTDDRWRAEKLHKADGELIMYATGYARNVVQHVRSQDGFWSSRVIHHEEKPLHYLVAGDVDPAHPGDELVTSGHGGKLILLTPPS